MQTCSKARHWLALFALCSVLACPARAADDALFRQLGGKAGIDKIVGDMIVLVLADSRINGFFKTTDTRQLAILLSEQFCQAAGGPCAYSGRNMLDAHEGMGVKIAHFNALAEDLQIAMENNGVPSAASNQLIAKLAPLQRAIVR